MATPSLAPSAIVPPNPTTVRGQSAKLSLSPKGDRLVYCNGRSVVVRPVPGSIVETPGTPIIIYSQHPQPVTVARIAPSGAYVASADQSGLVRIWDILGGEQILKAEYRPFAGAIRDLAWDAESKRIAVVGQGKERFGHFFFMETGSSCGEVSGHGKVINSVALKSTRPFKAVTASDDTNLVFYAGVPYKYTATLSNHTRFAQAVVYSADGSHFASAGSDSKINVYDGASGTLKHSFEAGGGGSLFDLEFTASNDKLLSVGADGSARLWSLDGNKEGEWDLKAGHGNAGDQLVGVTITGQVGIALNLVGEFILFDLAQAGSVKQRYLNPTKGITTGVRVSEKEFLLASWDGNVYRYETTGAGQQWSVSTVEGFQPGGSVVTGLGIDKEGGTVYAVGMDDVLRKIRNGKTESFTAPLPAASKGLAVSSLGDVYVVTSESILALPSGSTSFSTTKLANASSSASAVAVSSDGKVFAVGSEDGKVRVFSSDSLSSSPKYTLEKNRSAITYLSFSPSGDLLAVGDSNGRILVFTTSSGDLKFNQWVFHTSRITSLDWTNDGLYLVSSSLDTHVYVWSTEAPMKRIEGKNLHAGGVGYVAWLQGTRTPGKDAQIVSAGSDGALKVWTAK